MELKRYLAIFLIFGVLGILTIWGFSNLAQNPSSDLVDSDITSNPVNSEITYIEQTYTKPDPPEKKDYPILTTNESEGVQLDLGLKNTTIEKNSIIKIAIWITNTHNDQIFLLNGIVFQVNIKNPLNDEIYGVGVLFPEGFGQIGPQQLKPQETYGLVLSWKVEKDPYFTGDVIPGAGFSIVGECNLSTETGKSVKIISPPLIFEVVKDHIAS